MSEQSIKFHNDKSWQHFLEERIQFHDGQSGFPDQNDISYYILGLDRDETKEKMENITREFQIPKPFLFKSTHYKDINHDDLIKSGHLESKYAKARLKQKPRVVAIHVSHCAALKHFVDQGQSKWAMIFEEDANFPKGADYAKQETLAYIKDAESLLDPDSPQLHYIGHCWAPKDGDLISNRIVKGSTDIYAGRGTNPKCRHAYVVNHNGAKQLLNESWPMKDNGDEMWALVDFFYFHDEGGIIMQNEQDFPEEAVRKKSVKTERAQAERYSEEKNKSIDPVVLTLLILVVIISLVLGIFKKAFRLFALIVGVIGLIFIITGVSTKSIIYEKMNGDHEKLIETPAELKDGVTAIVLNHSRPHNIKKCVESLRKDRNVEKVILMNGKLDTKVTMTEPDVLCIDDFKNNEVYGGGRRFLLNHHQIDTKAVLFIDDDIYMKKGQVGEMLKEIENGEILVGPACRKCDGYGYKTKTETPDTVLTSTMMMPKSVLVDYQIAFERDYRDLLRETKGNGEDLSMNHFVRTHYGKIPKCIKMKVGSLDTGNGYSSKRGHYKKRDEMCKNFFIHEPRTSQT